ncbi:hypothetical protein XACW160_610021 [Xanthomonas citri pv. citri]|nr:hypothetical protein XACW160_610021 [Xanthomonas citri pv. citri]CEH40796.1 hypothetical protein XACLD7_10250016 [Xanthomonas citri pv. citri]CEH61816.1 hypothetical protein XACG102_7430009 [Xanthomonas citri pv. citri]CEH88334.1 hypothetical protein XACB100_1820019 [Xanthomonas citri pv. citri]CEH89015.1 hypothetical protein XACS581_1630021 [Xanthomonas citri pv. citri]
MAFQDLPMAVLIGEPYISLSEDV